MALNLTILTIAKGMYKMDIKTYVKVKFEDGNYFYVDLKQLAKRLRDKHVVEFHYSPTCYENELKNRNNIVIRDLRDVFTKDYFEIVNVIDENLVLEAIQEIEKAKFSINNCCHNEDVLNNLKQQYRLAIDVKCHVE